MKGTRLLIAALITLGSVVGANATVLGGKPAGCPPSLWCGCYASLQVFGRIIPTLNLAYNWVRQFNQAEPAPGMVAARSGHAFVLKAHVSGSDWLVLDGNTRSRETGGRHLALEHVRSIRGFRIVDPHSPRSGALELAARHTRHLTHHARRRLVTTRRRRAHHRSVKTRRTHVRRQHRRHS